VAPAPSPQTSTEIDELLFRLGQALRRLRVQSGDNSTFTYAVGAGFWQLDAIDRHGPVRISDLATELNLDISTVSRQLKALAERGLVQKAVDEEDARASRVELTDAGRTALTALRRRRHELLERALASWDLERRGALVELLGDLVRDLETAVSQLAEEQGVSENP